MPNLQFTVKSFECHQGISLTHTYHSYATFLKAKLSLETTTFDNGLLQGIKRGRKPKGQ